MSEHLRTKLAPVKHHWHPGWEPNPRCTGSQRVVCQECTPSGILNTEKTVCCSLIRFAVLQPSCWKKDSTSMTINVSSSSPPLFPSLMTTTASNVTVCTSISFRTSIGVVAILTSHDLHSDSGWLRLTDLRDSTSGKITPSVSWIQCLCRINVKVNKRLWNTWSLVIWTPSNHIDS